MSGGCTDHFVTGPGGFLQSITHGYGGVRLSDDALTLRPSLPENTDRLTLRRFAYLGVGLSLEVNANGIVLEALLERSAEESHVPQLEVTSAGSNGFKRLQPGQPLRFGVGVSLTVRAV